MNNFFNGNYSGNISPILFRGKPPVATYNSLPLVNNEENDLRAASDTDKLYMWTLATSTGLITDWIEIGSASVTDLDSVTDGTTYGKVKLSELEKGQVKRLDDGTNEVTAANAKDAVDKKHSQNTDTDLDDTFEATFVKKVDTVNVLSDITSSGADIESAVSLKHSNSLDHTQNTDTSLDLGGSNEVTAEAIKSITDRISYDAENDIVTTLAPLTPTEDSGQTLGTESIAWNEVISYKVTTDNLKDKTNDIDYTMTQVGEAIDSAHTQGTDTTVGAIKSGATQVLAGAAAGELWGTVSHATLPDNVVMVGV